MFLLDCGPYLLENFEVHYTFENKQCQFQYVAYHTNPPLSLVVSRDYIIEILNAVIDEETQLDFAASYFALTDLQFLDKVEKKPIPLKDSKITPAIEKAKQKK